jgi:hypothetical protein
VGPYSRDRVAAHKGPAHHAAGADSDPTKREPKSAYVDSESRFRLDFGARLADCQCRGGAAGDHGAILRPRPRIERLWILTLISS